MALSFKWLGDGYLGASAGTMVANPSGKKTLVRVLHFYNNNTTTETIKVYRVPDNASAVGTAGVANLRLKISLPAGESYAWEVPAPGWVLVDENDSIQGETTTADKVVYSIDGAEV